MLCQNNKIELRLSVEADREGIKKVFESGKFDGDFCVRFLRNPDPAALFAHDGDKAVVMVMEYISTKEVIAVAGCVIRREYVHSQVIRIGYLTGLKILPEYQKKVYCITDGYKFLHENTKNDVDMYYTTILSSNTGAQKLLEKKHRNMPSYLYLGDYTTYCIKAGGIKDTALTGASAKELADLYCTELPKLDFAPFDTGLFGLHGKDFFTMRGKKGEIIASCAVYNQQAYKQYVVCGYSRKYKLLSKIPVQLLGYPGFPPENSTLNYAGIAFLYIRDGSPALGRRFLKAVAAQAGQYDLLLLGLFCNNPNNMLFKKYRHVKFQSRLYEVAWEEKKFSLENPIGLEVSLL